MTKPITPSEVVEQRKADIPSKVIGVWNSLIAKNMNASNSSTVTQDDAVEAIMVAMSCERGDVFVQKWLDIESIFREAGWKVQYDKPAYFETYNAFFVFTPDKT